MNKYELVFPEVVNSEEVNKALYALFGAIKVDIDWRDDRTVVVTTDVVIS